LHEFIILAAWSKDLVSTYSRLDISDFKISYSLVVPRKIGLYFSMNLNFIVG